MRSRTSPRSPRRAGGGCSRRRCRCWGCAAACCWSRPCPAARSRPAWPCCCSASPTAPSCSPPADERPRRSAPAPARACLIPSQFRRRNGTEPDNSRDRRGACAAGRRSAAASAVTPPVSRRSRRRGSGARRIGARTRSMPSAASVAAPRGARAGHAALREPPPKEPDMVDVPAQLQSVTRTYRVEERDGEPAHVQTLEQTYPAPLADVWAAVTTAERIQRWFLPVSGDLRPGGRYQFEGNAGGEILACEPPADGTAEVAVTWEMMGAVSWVTLRLAADGEESTRVELEHTSRTADVPAEMWETFGPGATGVGWDGGLLGLALHLGATEGSLSPAEAEAWAATDE